MAYPTVGVLALFSRAFFPELTALRATEEAKQVMIRHHHEVFRVPFTGGAINIDTPEDYEQFRTIERS